MPDNDEAKSPVTLTSTVFEKLRSDILEGVIPPGGKLRIDELRERYNVGASPVREALNRLSSMHLVEQSDQRGFRVTSVSSESVLELARTRCWISEIAIREAIRHGDAAWEDGIVLALHRLWRIQEGHTESLPVREWEAQHRRFHSALIAACPSHWIREFHETLFDLADRERHISRRPLQAYQASSQDQLAAIEAVVQRTMQEHRDITEAVVKRDVTRSIELLNQHFMRTAEIALQVAAPDEVSLASALGSVLN